MEIIATIVICLFIGGAWNNNNRSLGEINRKLDELLDK